MQAPPAYVETETFPLGFLVVCPRVAWTTRAQGNRKRIAGSGKKDRERVGITRLRPGAGNRPRIIVAARPPKRGPQGMPRTRKRRDGSRMRPFFAPGYRANVKDGHFQGELPGCVSERKDAAEQLHACMDSNKKAGVLPAFLCPHPQWVPALRLGAATTSLAASRVCRACRPIPWHRAERLSSR